MFSKNQFQIFILLFAAFISSCAVRPKGNFNPEISPIKPDYSQSQSWAALPNRADNADRTPNSSLIDQQETAEVDVFFLHPTTYTGKKGHKSWNGPIDDPKLNARTDEGTILYQASIFNGVGKIYAPRYRQAHLHAYFTKDRKADAKRAFDLAYTDIKNAFDYYLQNYNRGRPIIIAAHSQGTTHAARLLKEYFDDKALQDKLVVAYLIGIPIPKDHFQSIKICENAQQTDCFCSWRTYKKGHYPKYPDKEEVAVTNPLLWTNQPDYADKSLNQGGVLRNFEKVLPSLADAQIHSGLLWINKPKFPWSFLYWSSNFHIADYNLYYMNIRNNAIERAKSYLANQKR